MTDGSPAPSPVADRRAHFTLAMLTVISSFNYLDRNLFSIVLQSIKAEMHLSDTALGLVGGFAFVMFYSILGVPIAWLADRVNRRNIISLGLAFWSLMTALTGLVQNVWQLALTRFLMGAGEASSIAPSNSMLSDLYARGRRPLVLSVFSCGAGLGTLAGYMMGGWVDQHFGWRAAFYIAGVPGLLMALLFYLTVKEPARGGAEQGMVSLAAGSFLQTLRYLSGSRAYVFMVLGGCMMAVHLYASIIWSPAFLIRVHGLSSAETGAYVGLIRGPLGILGVLAGGVIAVRLGRRDERWRIWAPALACIAAAPAEVMFLFSPTLALSITGLGFASLFTAMHLGPVYAAMLGVARVRMRAVATATFLFFVNLFGQTVGPLGVGYLSDLMIGRYGETAIRYSMLLGAMFSFLAGLLFWQAARHIVQDSRRALED
jgi:MFS family permease